MRPPRHLPPPDTRAVRSLALKLIVLIVLLIAAFQSISIYVESLWYGSLGFEPVYWYRLRAQSAVFLTVGIATTIALWLIFRLVMPPPGYMRRPFLQFGQETISIPTSDTLKKLALPASIVFGVLFGITFTADWNTFALFLNRTDTQGVVDPIFNRPLSFYLFTLPVLENLASWFLAISIIGVIVAVLLSAVDMLASFRGVSFAVSLLLAATAFQVYVSRFSLLFDEHDLFTGVRYVDHNIVIPGLLFVIVALLTGAAVAAANIRLSKLRNLGLAIAIPALTYVVAGVIAPFYVATFVVRPNELVREKPYIKNNIEFTRKAFGLDNVEEIPFEPRVTNAVFDAAQHSDTLANVRLWDWRALQKTLQQIQEIRPYYDFQDIDVDRYMINGKP